MNKKTETVLKDLEGQARTASLDMEQEEAAEFFDQLADWAYAQSEACLIEPDIGCRIMRKTEIITNLKNKKWKK